MKKILIILLLILSVLLIGCSKEVIADTIPVTSIVTATSIIEDTAKIDELTKQLDDLTARLSLSKDETEKYQALIGNLNSLLENIYYGYASNSKWTSDGFTAFSIKYKDKIYLITAGHAVHYKYDKIDTGVYTHFKFKANFSNNWIYPKLLTYENDYTGNRDYAVFYSDKVNTGFDVGKVYGGNFVLGSINNKLNVIRKLTVTPISGESGSPVINVNGEVIGILTGSITYIDTVLQAIDNLK